MFSRVAVASLATMVLSCVAACGGEEGSRPQRASTATVVGPVNYCSLLQSYDYLTILDVSSRGVACPGGPPPYCQSVWMNSSAPDGGTPLAGSPGVEVVTDAPCGEVRAAHIQVKEAALAAPADNLPDAGPYSSSPGGWGGVFGISMGAFDASEYEGISFMVKRGRVGTGQSLSVSMPDQNSGSSSRLGCVQSSPADVRRMCDAYGVSVGFDDQWRLFAIPFTQMAQRGFGMPYPRELFLSSGITSIAEVKMEFAPSADWDFYIAGVSFYKKKGS